MKERVTLAIEDRNIPVENIIVLADEMPFPPLNEEMIEKIKETITRYGLVYKPVVIPATEGRYYLVDGRNRLSALIKLGYREIPCTVINALPEERKALYYVIECFRRHLTEEERARAEEKFKEVEEEVTVQIREKVKSFLMLRKVPKNVISHILKNITPQNLAFFYSMLEKDESFLIPVLKTISATSEGVDEKEIAQTVLKELEKKRLEFEKEKTELERQVKELLAEKQKSEERIRQLEQEISVLEEELDKLRNQVEAVSSEPRTLSLDDPEVKKLVDRYVQERAKREADEIVRIALKKAMSEQAELQKRLSEVLNERNKFLREKQELESKLQELEKKNKAFDERIKSWQDNVQYLRNLLSNIVSVNTVLKEFDAVILRLQSIYTSLVFLKGAGIEAIQETQMYSLVKKYQELEGYLEQIRKAVNDIEHAVKANLNE